VLVAAAVPGRAGLVRGPEVPIHLTKLAGDRVAAEGGRVEVPVAVDGGRLGVYGWRVEMLGDCTR
jgi:hypothetical protein